MKTNNFPKACLLYWIKLKRQQNLIKSTVTHIHSIFIFFCISEARHGGALENVYYVRRHQKGQAEHSSCSLIRGRKLQFSAGVRLWSKPLTSAIITHAKLPTERQAASKHTFALLRFWHTLIKGICFVCLRGWALLVLCDSVPSKARSSLTCFDIGSNNNLSRSDQRERGAAAWLTWAI